ncbi:MAG: uroporphyrinogen-III synthase [Alloprevotella sp.]|nr:uroporphyrinogen-III synthase [Bacteroidales bacterium]MCI6252954.1 uroporphyrinogen-III synthase [Bacteroidales bacterium]MDY2604643.1 uroporphyrinogen-III synthase [Alloprevotella sp.]MDY4029974.1 uroporphyrinogen-III synthase [Alloprevotella sp.]MDY5087475.1 uroporphyrinogen-III synthase [Alloprevotella sp.]
MVKKILISQPRPTSEKSPYFEIEKKYGVQLVFHPFIKVECLTAREFRQQKVQILDHTAIVFNSRHAIDHFFTLCKEMRIAIPETMKYFGISEMVSLYIQKYVQFRKRKVFYPTSGKLADLIALMAKHKAETYLVPQSDVHSDELHNMAEAKKLQVRECVMYRTLSNDLPSDTPFDFDMVVLFTPAGVESLLKNVPNFKETQAKLACFGKSTAKAIEDAGLPLELEAPSVKAPSITGSLELYLEEHNKA